MKEESNEGTWWGPTVTEGEIYKKYKERRKKEYRTAKQINYHVGENFAEYDEIKALFDEYDVQMHPYGAELIHRYVIDHFKLWFPLARYLGKNPESFALEQNKILVDTVKKSINNSRKDIDVAVKTTENAIVITGKNIMHSVKAVFTR